VSGPREFDCLEAERLRRLQECFRADRPNNSEVRAALQRWHLTQIRPVRTLPVRALWVIVGTMLLSGVAMAATHVAQLPVWTSLTSWAKAVIPSAAPARPAHSRCSVQRAGRRTDCVPSARLKLAPGEHATLIVNDVRTELVGPGVAHLRLEVQSGTWASQFEPQGWVPELRATHAMPAATDKSAASSQPTATTFTDRDALKPRAPAPASPAPVPREPLSFAPDADEVPPTASATPASPLDGAWSRAASALRRGDDVAARSALSEISRSSDPASRDAALLARAQLDLARGSKETAMPLLNELARRGSTAFVRQRAQEIIVSGK